MKTTIRLALSAFLISLIALSPRPAAAVPKTLTIHLALKNTSTTCAWVTVYWSKNYLSWQKMYYGWIHPSALNQYMVTIPQYEPMKYPSELKVRAEFKKNPDCTGGTVADYHAQRKDIFGTEMGGFVTYVHQTLSGPPWSVNPIHNGKG